MKKILVTLGMLCLGFAILIAGKDAKAVKGPTLAPIAQAGSTVLTAGSTEAQMMKSCSNNSDCPYGGCSGGSCGSCSNNSDCKGYGECSGGHCGSCSNNSDCGKFGDCNSHRCSKSPY